MGPLPGLHHRRAEAVAAELSGAGCYRRQHPAARGNLAYSSAPGQPASPPRSSVTLGSASVRPAVVGDTTYATLDELSYSREVAASG